MLTQETVYQSILKSRREVFHEQVGRAMEALYQEGLEEYYEELAYHYDRSADGEKAVEYLLKAGAKARGVYLNQEAVEYYGRVLERLGDGPLDEAGKRRKLEALNGLGMAYFGMGSRSKVRTLEHCS